MMGSWVRVPQAAPPRNISVVQRLRSVPDSENCFGLSEPCARPVHQLTRPREQFGLSVRRAPRRILRWAKKLARDADALFSLDQLAEPKEAPLIFPVQRQVGGAQQAPPGQRRGLPPLNNRSYDVGCQPAHFEKPSDMRLAVAADESIRAVAEKCLLSS